MLTLRVNRSSEASRNTLKRASDGVILDLEVIPGARIVEIAGYNPWRKRIKIKLSSKAEKGRANQQLVSTLSELFNVNAKDVIIISGILSNSKSIKILGAEAEEVEKILESRVKKVDKQ